jgi:arylsulfatase A-like enzyme
VKKEMNEIEKPNVFFLLIDSFRADKFYGKNKTSITPNLDSLIKQGIYFTQTINASPASIPAISSVLTAKWPFKAIIKGEKRHQLNRKFPNFVNRFNELEYNTIALTPQIFADSELTTDFNTSLRFEGGLHDGVGQQIIDILEKLEKPWFFFAHILDIHGSARNYPQKFNDKKYGINQYERRISAMDQWFGRFLQKIDLEKTLIILTADHSTDRGIYTPKMEQLKTDLNKNDLQPFVRMGKKLLFGTISKKAKKFYLNRKTKTKIQKQDKALEDKQNLSPYDKRVMNNLVHPGFDIYDNRYRIPLLFTGLGLESKIIDQQVRSLDIFPTIFDIIKIPIKTMSVDGTSIFPLTNDVPFEESPVLMENISNWIKPKKGTTPQVGIRYNNFKYFRLRDHPDEKISLFDLAKDPLEEHNLAREYPSKIIEMEKILLKIRFNVEEGFKKKSTELINSKEEKISIEKKPGDL